MEDGLRKILAWTALGVVGCALVGGIAFPYSDPLLVQPKKSSAGAASQAIASAVMEYQLEYGRLPGLPGTDTTFQSDSELIVCLFGEHSEGADFPNPREIVFLEPSSATESGLGGYDPWGNPYQVAIDLNDDNHLADPEDGEEPLRKTVLVWSAGPDGVLSTWRDNVMTW